jgi:hypothetical protein
LISQDRSFKRNQVLRNLSSFVLSAKAKISSIILNYKRLDVGSLKKGWHSLLKLGYLALGPILVGRSIVHDAEELRNEVRHSLELGSARAIMFDRVA